MESNILFLRYGDNKMIKDCIEKINQIIKDVKINNQLANHNYITAANNARKWIKRNTIHGNGIVITNKQRKIYQEVTGYYIPTLLQWGMRDEAIAYAKYLCSVQQDNGAWLDSSLTRPNVFNTGQVIRGLLAIEDIYPEAHEHLIKGCDYLVSRVNEYGRLVPSEGTEFAPGFNSELIHLYCLPQLRDTGLKHGNRNYVEKSNDVLHYYIDNYEEDINNFNYLSHFYAYVLEALLDMGETDIVKNAMKKIAFIQRLDGSVPAFKDCNWVCSTGLFQLSIVWFKLGDWERGNRAFDYAVSLQNQSGGWYGGYRAGFRLGSNRINYAYNENISYFPDQEISWAVKYFFDALYFREKREFNYKAHTFMDRIDSNDLKFVSVYDEVKRLSSTLGGRPIRIADIGCGKGRYLKKLIVKAPENEYWGVDLSEKVLRYAINTKIKRQTGSILNTRLPDDYFDVVYAAESTEHAIFIDLAIKEMVRILKPGGSLIIIDKEQESFDRIKYADWIDPKELSTKQWMTTSEITEFYKNEGLDNINIHWLPSAEGNMYKAYIGMKRIK